EGAGVNRHHGEERQEPSKLLGFEVAAQQIVDGQPCELIEEALRRRITEDQRHVLVARRRSQKPRFGQSSEALQLHAELDEALAISVRQLSDLSQGAIEVLPDQQTRPVAEDARRDRIGAVRLVAEPREFELTKDPRSEQSEQKRAGREAKAGHV